MSPRTSLDLLTATFLTLALGATPAVADGYLDKYSPEELRLGIEDGRQPELLGNIQIGETVTGRMPAIDPGDPSPGRLAWSDASPKAFDLKPLASGPVTIHARSLDFDARLVLYRVEVNGELTLVNKDDDCGHGPDSRLRVHLDANTPYRIVVEREREINRYFPDTLTAFCPGEFELVVQPGADEIDPLAPSSKPDPQDCRTLEGRIPQKADTEYWTAVRNRADGDIPAECRVESRLREYYSGLWHRKAGESLSTLREAMTLAEKELDADSPLLAEVLAPFAMQECNVKLRQPNMSPEERAKAIEERIALYQEAFETRERWLGADHVDIAWSHVINKALHLQGAEERLASIQRAVAALRQALGSAHRDVGFALMIQADLTLPAAMDNPLPAAKEMVKLYREALVIFDAELWPWHGHIIHCTNSLGATLLGLGDWSEAKAVAERNLQIRMEGAQPYFIAVGQYRYAIGVLLPAGYYREAKEHLEKAMAVFAPQGVGGVRGDVLLAHMAYAELLRATGAYADAETILRDIIESREERGEEDTSIYAYALQLLAKLKRETGAPAEARDLLERALAVFDRNPEAASLPNAQTNVDSLMLDLGGVLYELGAYDEARDYLASGVKSIEDMGGADHPGIVDPLNDLAMTDHALGSYEEAERTYKRALVLVARTFGEEHPRYAAILSNLARLYIDMGRRLEAMDAAILAEQIGREHTHLTVGSLHEEAALAYAAVRSSGLDLAVSLAAISSDEPARSGRPGPDPVMDNPMDSSGVLDAMIRSRAVILDEMAARRRTRASSDPLVQKWVAACERLANLQVMGPGDNPIELYRALLDDARSEKNQAEEAMASSSDRYQNEDARRRLGLTDIRGALPADSVLLSFVQYDRYLAGTNGDRPSDTRSFAAFLLHPRENEPAVVPLGSAAEIDALVSSWRAATVNGPNVEMDNQREAEAAYRQHGEALRHRIWDPLAPLMADARQVFVVPDGTLNLVTLAALPTGDAGFLVDDGPLIHVLATERDLVPEANQATGNGGLLLVGAPAYDATTLFASLAPAQSDDSTAPPLQVASESHDLDGVPESARLAAGTSAQTGGTSPVQIASATLDGPGSVAYFRGQRSGCGNFESLSFSPLPGAAREAQEVADLWRSTHVNEQASGARESLPTEATPDSPSASPPVALGGDLLYIRDAQASETAVKERASGQRILHLATHGFFLGGHCQSALDGGRGIGGLTEAAGKNATEGGHPAPPPGENPLLLSGLALAGANHREAAGPDEDDGILTAEEIAALDLSGVEWAVLSACDTGVGEVRAGEGVFGLRRAFQVAGARTLIMSLWSVDDEATREWMTALYEVRLRQGMTTAEAVHHASLSTLNARRERGESTHPFYWAGFVAAGDWR